MKKAIPVIFLLVLLAVLTACGVSSEARQVMELIDAIDTITLESESAILAAEQAYEALNDEQKSEVENYVHLSNARILYDDLRREADYQAFRDSLIGTWVDITDPEAAVMLTLREDGTAEIDGFSYEWTLNPNLETVRFEGSGRIVLAVTDDGERLWLYNPDLMTCLKETEYAMIADKQFRTIRNSAGAVDLYLGEAVDVGSVTDEKGKETRLFAFRSAAYDKGWIYLCCSGDYYLAYQAGRNFKGVLYDPFFAASYEKADQLAAIKVTDSGGSVYFISTDLVSSVSFDPETKIRTVTLYNGIEIRRECSMNPTVEGVRYNAYDYLSEGDFTF